MSVHTGKIKENWQPHYEYGFIVDENGDEIRFDIADNPDLLDKRSSLSGVRVEFEKRASEDRPGKYEAYNVRLPTDHHVNDNTQDISSSSPSEDDTSQENAPPKTCLILTIGTNALPVWVAWHHLRNWSENLPHPIRVQLVHTKETEPEMERLRKEINEYYKSHSSEGFVKNVQTSPGDPYKVFKDITDILNKLPGETEHIHVHYTGGTQVMGVETVSAAAKFDGRKKVSTSYLTVHADSGPAIRGLKLGKPEDSEEADTPEHSSVTFSEDTRVGIFGEREDLELLKFVASLNGFEIGPFTHISPQGNKSERRAPVQFKGEYLTIGKHLLKCVNRSQFKEIVQLGQEWSKRNYKEGGDFCSNLSLWKDIVFPFFKGVYSDLNFLQWSEETSTLSYPSSTFLANLPEVQRERFKGIGKFFTSNWWFEYAIAAAFHSALCEIDCARNDDNSRSDYAIFHNVHVQRIPTEDNVSVKDFELDVVAMLGHQIVVVSCTTDQGQGLQGLIKEKGMEVLHRARQLGGDEARGIVLCRASENEAKLVDDELKDETGGASEPLQIWGVDKLSTLTREFKDYCKELHWE